MWLDCGYHKIEPFQKQEGWVTQEQAARDLNISKTVVKRLIRIIYPFFTCSGANAHAQRLPLRLRLSRLVAWNLRHVAVHGRKIRRCFLETNHLKVDQGLLD